MSRSSRKRPRRGAAENPEGRFERLRLAVGDAFSQPDPDAGERPDPRTRYLRDPSRSALAYNDSPDLPFDASLNPYRGCEHGCSYCYARPSHEYLGLSAGLDFETRIFVKHDAPELLRRELASPRWRPRVVAMGGVTDAYQPIDRTTRLARRCLEVFRDFRNPVSVVTKSALVTRDVDLLGELARFDAASVHISLTTLDPALQRAMEPRAAAPARRLRTLEALASSGVPVGALVAPIVPGLNDHEIPAILAAAARAGAGWAGRVMLRLPNGLGPLFEAWLERHFPERRSKVMARIRAVGGGRLYDARYHVRQRGQGVFAEQTHALFDLARRRAGLGGSSPALSSAAFRRPTGEQLSLFDGDRSPP